MGEDSTKNTCRFANPPLNVCNCLDQKENGTGLSVEYCNDNYRECERYETFSRILENLDRKNNTIPSRYNSISALG